MRVLATILFVSLLHTLYSAPSDSAPKCTQSDLLIDNFNQSRRMIIDGADRQVNWLDADYGTEGPLTTLSVDPQSGTLTVIPGTDTAFFFAKFVNFV